MLDKLVCQHRAMAGKIVFMLSRPLVGLLFATAFILAVVCIPPVCQAVLLNLSQTEALRQGSGDRLVPTHHEASRELLELAYHVHPTDYLQFRTSLLNGNLQEAVSFVRQPGSAPTARALSIMVGYAVMANERQDRQQAVSTLQAALGAHATHPDLHRRLAYYLRANGEYEAFADHLSIAAGSGLARVTDFRDLTAYYDGNGRTAAGAAWIKYGLQLFPEDRELTIEKGRNALLAREVEQAIELFRGVIERNPNWTDGYLPLVEAYGLAGNWTAAAETNERALELSPDRTDVQRSMAMVLVAQQDYMAALKFALKAVALDPNSSASWYRLGSIYHGLKDYPAAAGALASCLRLAPADLECLIESGQVYDDMGQQAQARALFVRALQLHIGPTARQYLEGEIRRIASDRTERP